MSDPMTNMEIEDVLSSIRRLVSEDHRAPARGPVHVARRPDKLVLTPALRIVPDTPPPAAAVVPDLPPPTETIDDILSNEAAAAVLEAAFSHHKDDWEPDGSEVVGGTDWTVEWEAGSESDVSVLEYAPTETPVPAGPVPEATSPFEQSESAPVDASEETGTEDDGSMAFFSTHRQDRADDPATAPEDDLRFSIDDEAADPLIDAEAIRDIVREVLREELQGPLGERITRNVRKLVRAEINRALAARELN